MKRPKRVAEVECPACDGTGFARVEQPAKARSQNLSTALQAMFGKRAH
jgi:hypothetical protein